MKRTFLKIEDLPLPNRKVYGLIQEFTNGNIKAFADSINISQQSLNRIFCIDKRNGKYPSVSDEIKEGIIRVYGKDEIWFITENLDNSKINGDEKKEETRPRIPYDAEAGTLTEAVEGISEYQCERAPVIKVFPNYDFTIRITGRSMEPEYYAGDEVACLRINEKRFLQWGRVHVLDTTQGIVIKRIYDNGEYIKCKSYNPEFPDFLIPKEDIHSYNLVVGSIRL